MYDSTGDTSIKVSTRSCSVSALSFDSTRSVRETEEGAVASHGSEGTQSAKVLIGARQVSCIQLLDTMLSPFMSRVMREQGQRDGQEDAEKVFTMNQVSLVGSEFSLLSDSFGRIVEKPGVKVEHGGPILGRDAGVSVNLPRNRVQDVANRSMASSEGLTEQLSPVRQEAQAEAKVVEQGQRQGQSLLWEAREAQWEQVGRQDGEAWLRHCCLGAAAVLCTKLYTSRIILCTELHNGLMSLFTEPSKDSQLQIQICQDTTTKVELDHCHDQQGGEVLRAGTHCEDGQVHRDCHRHWSHGAGSQGQIQREGAQEPHHPHYRRGVVADLGGVGHTTLHLQQVKVKILLNPKSRSPTLGMSAYIRSMFAEGSRVQHQQVQGQRLLLTYGTERMLDLAENAGNERLLLLPDELFSPGQGWQMMLEEDPNYAGLAFYPYVKVGENSQVAVIPFTITMGKLEDLRMVIPSYLMSKELGDWLENFREEVTSGGGQVSADSYPLSFHVLVKGMALHSLMSFLEEALTVGMDLLVIPMNNIQWSRHCIGRVG